MDLGDTAVALLKAGAEADKQDTEGHTALDLAPDKEVRLAHIHASVIFLSCYCRDG